ncbi:MAG: hypothetical protein K8F60_12060 [Melioribacteraceae bacterium]|jgi:uncharacterized membrane protein|nr:hypothetical protein [Ignavibacteriota bacterium]MBZ0183184.1 hypothetical protein [Melioribacteraceae bacterium]
MELIPILSLIILVATISTFILAVGAYILYKIRERKGRTAQAAQPSAIPGELVAPAQLAGAQGETRRTIIEERAPTRESIYETRRYTDVREEGPEMRPTFVSPSTSSGSYSETKYQRPSGRETGESERFTPSGRKFSRYTTENYVDQKKVENKKKEEPLRWR